MAKNNIYQQNGYKDRVDYLQSVAEDYGTDMMIVSSMAEILGDDEDFDGLISALEDIPIVNQGI
mgnify:CR=1 FL=1